ncbi:lysostaphin resistance A-like protein [Balneola sp. MJW-20]|uniref:CPBP family intramembrane glutamic endopeptidase n=1 Tax=Gracilimonas aurantiaca TaxID=3234185 RepID=UPI0034673DCB
MFIAQAKEGDNRWWKYLSSVLVIIGSFLLGQVPLFLFSYYKKIQSGLSDDQFSEFLDTLSYTSLGISQNTFFLLIMGAFSLTFCAVIFLVPKIHKRPNLSFITSRKKFDHNRFWIGLFTWLIISCCITFLVLDANQYEYTFEIGKFIPLVIIAVALVPMQSATEEIVYRGFIMQGVYKLLGRKWATLMIVALLFAISHAFNPEFKNGFITIIPAYLIFSFTLTYITVIDEGIEIPIGIHTGNNLFVALILSARGASVTTPSIFTTSIGNLIDILPILLGSLSIISFMLLKLRYKWKLALK